MATKLKIKSHPTTKLIVSLAVACFLGGFAFIIFPLQNIQKNNFQVNCAKIQKPSDIFLCYNNLRDVKRYLANIQVSTPDNKLLSGNQYVFQIVNLYNGNGTAKEKQIFFNTYINNYGFPLRKQKEYIFRLVHMLWFEKYGNAPWSIQNYTTSQIESLIWVNDLAPQTKPHTPLNQNRIFVDSSLDFLNIDSIIKLPALASTFIENNKNATILSILRWQKKNFFHAYFDYGWNQYNDNIPNQNVNNLDGEQRFGPNSLERLFEERITGCHENSYLFSHLLRSINIPAVAYQDFSGHGLVYLPLSRKFVHGDHIADYVTVPTESLLLTQAQVEAIDAGGAYDQVIRDLFPFPNLFALANMELHREQNNLFIETDSVCVPLSQEIWDTVAQEVPEFNIRYDQERCEISSDLIPIQTLQELSQRNQ